MFFLIAVLDLIWQFVPRIYYSINKKKQNNKKQNKPKENKKTSWLIELDLKSVWTIDFQFEEKILKKKTVCYN